MNEICRINKFDIDKISLLFCYKCNSLINDNSKKCTNLKCSKIYCNKCINDSKCPECRIGKLNNISMASFLGLDILLFCCNKSMKCKEKYSYEEKMKNHLHKKHEIIKCNKCQENLNQTANFLKCSKCQNFFCYKRLNYNPFLDEKDNITQENNFDKECGIKCIKCLKQICSLCNKNPINNLICNDCFDKNSDEDKEKKVTNKCNLCSNNNCCNVCSICNINICLPCSNTCENNLCKNIICINCSLLCNICKNIICKKCSIKCSSCPPNKSIVSCINCDSDAIIKCSMKNCTNKLCLNCIKYCNYCKEINCLNHSLSCANCSETICPFHWHMCKKCSGNSEDFSKKKLCLKNCTKKCHFCSNEINLLCKEENHPDNFIKKYSCGHYICNLCIKKCDICKEPIRACLECEIENNYVHCKLCDKYICFYCSKKCSMCGSHYCDEIHKCYFCQKDIGNEVCISCDFYERTKCRICSKGLRQCEKCSKIIICSYKCFTKHTKIKPKVNRTFRHSRTAQSIKSNITNNVINNVVNLFNNEKTPKNEESQITNYKNNVIETIKGEHICLMYSCQEHYGRDIDEAFGEFNSREDQEKLNNIRSYNRVVNKESVKCSSCEIY